MLAAWDAASSNGDLSTEVKETIKVASQNFSSAYNGERMAQSHFWNGQDLVAMRCDQAGSAITFNNRDVPLAPVR